LSQLSDKRYNQENYASQWWAMASDRIKQREITAVIMAEKKV